MAKSNNQKQSNGSNLDFEAQLWAAADKMRGHMDASEYKTLRSANTNCSNRRVNRDFSLSASNGERAGVRCRSLHVPPEARWHTIKAKAKSPEIGKVIDDAMGAIERENPTLKGVLPRDYARPSLDTATRDSANPICESHRQDFCGAKDHVRLGGLVDIISNIGFNESAAKSKDVLGRVYEYFLGKFASAEGTLQSANTNCSNQRMNRRGIQSVHGQRWPCASTSGGMFVSSEKFVEEHGGRVGDIAVYGQESNYTTWKLARMMAETNRRFAFGPPITS